MNTIYILIILWGGTGTHQTNAMLAVEFTSYDKCMATANKLYKDREVYTTCAPK